MGGMEEESPHQPKNCSSPPSHLEKFPPSGLPFLCMRCNCLKAIQSHYEETVYFLPEIPGAH